MFWVTFHTAKHYFWTILPVDYLVKMGRMDKEQALFEQITLSDFKKWSTTALQTLSQFWEKFWKPKALLKCPKMFFTLNTLLVLILTFLSWIFSHVEKRLDQKNKVNFKNLWSHNLVKKQLQLQYTYWPISQEVKVMIFGQLIESNVRNISLWKIIHKMPWRYYSQILF